MATVAPSMIQTPSRRRVPATPATFVSPTALQRALAYVANGDLPPLPRMSAVVGDGLLSFTLSTAACLALGALLGQEFAR